jgi:hypothetical protein
MKTIRIIFFLFIAITSACSQDNENLNPEVRILVKWELIDPKPISEEEGYWEFLPSMFIRSKVKADDKYEYSERMYYSIDSTYLYISPRGIVYSYTDQYKYKFYNDRLQLELVGDKNKGDVLLLYKRIK